MNTQKQPDDLFPDNLEKLQKTPETQEILEKEISHPLEKTGKDIMATLEGKERPKKMDMYEEYAMLVSGLSPKEYLRRDNNYSRNSLLRHNIKKIKDPMKRLILEMEYGIKTGIDDESKSSKYNEFFNHHLDIGENQDAAKYYGEKISNANEDKIKQGESRTKEYYLKLLRTGDVNSEYRLAIEYFDMEQKKHFLTAPEEDLKFSLPSYIIWKMFRERKLENYGITDENFLQLFKINKTSLYLNFAKLQGEKVVNNSPFLKVNYNENFQKAYKEELGKLVGELLPLLNWRKGRGLPDNQYPAILDLGEIHENKEGFYSSKLPGTAKYNEISKRLNDKGEKELEEQEKQELEEKRIKEEEKKLKQKLDEELNGGKNKSNSIYDTSFDELKANLDKYALLPLLKKLVERINKSYSECKYNKDLLKNLKPEGTQRKLEIETEYDKHKAHGIELCALYEKTLAKANEKIKEGASVGLKVAKSDIPELPARQKTYFEKVGQKEKQ